jgi:hypothetical protein
MEEQGVLSGHSQASMQSRPIDFLRDFRTDALNLALDARQVVSTVESLSQCAAAKEDLAHHSPVTEDDSEGELSLYRIRREKELREFVLHHEDGDGEDDSEDEQFSAESSCSSVGELSEELRKLGESASSEESEDDESEDENDEEFAEVGKRESLAQSILFRQHIGNVASPELTNAAAYRRLVMIQRVREARTP